jgi:hypothetical protein
VITSVILLELPGCESRFSALQQIHELMMPEFWMHSGQRSFSYQVLLLAKEITVKDWARKASPRTDERMKKLEATINTEIIFIKGYQRTEICTLASGLGANRSIRIKEDILMIHK